MPKRRSRGGFGGSPRKSPRKSGSANANLSSEDLNEEEKVKRPPNVIFQFDDDGDVMELEVNPLDVLVCLDKEESANENQVPCKVKDEPESLTNRCLQNVSSGSSPLKRASPLSPTLLDNVQQRLLPPPLPVANGTELSVDSPLPNETVPKIEVDIPSVPATEFTSEDELKAQITNGATELPSKVEELQLTEGSSVSEKTSQSQSQASASTTSTVTETASNGMIELPNAVYRVIEDYDFSEMPEIEGDRYLKWMPRSKVDICKDVEYELDETDICWLRIINKRRCNFHGLNLGKVEAPEMELLMDRLEKEHYYELQNNGMGQPAESDEDAVCCICLDGESDNSNQIIFCDMCNIPVHQDCYGVPFIPEGTWLCRRCSFSPTANLDCIFCPIKDGAFKQTVDGRWSHVLCALWIPEVRFANPSLVEPVDDICDIPPARWRLTCFLCKKKNVGACIQCHLRSCVTAFHPACAQKAGLSLKLETKESNCNIAVRMKASCDKHTSDKVREILTEKIETVNKVLNEKSDQPEKQFPSISKVRIDAISELVTFPGKSSFVKRLVAYWKLKRKVRGGAPLLRNLEAVWISNQPHPFAPSPLHREVIDDSLINTCYENMLTMHYELGHLKNFCDMLKTQSQLSRQNLELNFRIMDIRMQNVNPLHVQVIQQLKEKDKKEIFAEPVTDEEAPDYSTIIQQPMDLSTMQNKVFALDYSTLEDLEADFLLMINNCMTYNKKSTPFHRSAIKMKEDGEKIFDEARTERQRQIELEERLASKEYQEHERLIQLLLNTLDTLQNYDKNEIFKEPVDPEEVPDYHTIIKEPMDFSTMKKKIEEDKYSSIEDLEADYRLMINNCLEFNEDSSPYFKIARRMRVLGDKVFQEKRSSKSSSSSTAESSPETDEEEDSSEDNNNNGDTDDSINLGGLSLENDLNSGQASNGKILHDVLMDTFQLLVAEDDDGVFSLPVDVEEYPDYLDIVKSPMDFSAIERKLNDLEYTSLEDMEKDYNLMIANCKQFNGRSSEYYGIAVDMKKVGDMIFRKAKKQLRSKCRKH